MFTHTCPSVNTHTSTHTISTSHLLARLSRILFKCIFPADSCLRDRCCMHTHRHTDTHTRPNFAHILRLICASCAHILHSTGAEAYQHVSSTCHAHTAARTTHHATSTQHTAHTKYDRKMLDISRQNNDKTTYTTWQHTMQARTPSQTPC